MIKQIPSFGQLTAMVVFALSCFSLVLFLWVSFGGPVPLKPQGYRIHISFDEAVQLAQEGDVRISGVNVGKVKKVESSVGRTDAEVEIDERYAPLPVDVKAMLRTKTLLGETYIDLTPGTKGKKTIPENGFLPVGQVSTSVQLDELIRTFDPETRKAFGDWLLAQGAAMEGRGDDLNQAFGVLPMFFEDTNTLMAVLRREDEALSRIFGNTADIFEAFDSRPGQLTELINNFDRLLTVTANRDQKLTETFQEFPGFLRQTRQTVKRFTEFTENAQPLIDNATVFAEESGPTLKKSVAVMDDARAIINALEPMLDRADTGLPAGEEFFELAAPTLSQVDPFLRQLNPVLEFVGLYQKELTAFLANDAAAGQAQNTPDSGSSRQPGHYLRAMATFTPDSLAYLTNRTSGSRANAYPVPGSLSPESLIAGLQVFDASQCAGIAMPTLNTNDADQVSAGLADFVTRPTPTTSGLEAAKWVEIVQNIVYGNEAPTSYPAPACSQQSPMTFGGETTQYPHVRKRTTP